MARALIVVDVQNDFCEGGSLAVAGGAAVAAGVSGYLADHADDYAVVVATADWHEPLPETNGGHFATGEPDYVTTWPVHCVRDTPGAAYHPDLRLPAATLHVRKGQGRQDYSGFEGVLTDARGGALADRLRSEGIDEVDVVGLATDHCVAATSRDARAAGFDVRVLTDLTAGVGTRTSIDALTALAGTGVTLGHS